MQEASILIVDDIPKWRMTLKGLLSELGYRCEMASSKKEAIDLLVKHTYKLAIVDIRLDDWDENNQGGIEIVDWLVSTHSNTKAIVLTAYATVEFKRKALSSGVVVDFVPKTEIDELITTLAKVMQSS